MLEFTEHYSKKKGGRSREENLKFYLSREIERGSRGWPHETKRAAAVADFSVRAAAVGWPERNQRGRGRNERIWGRIWGRFRRGGVSGERRRGRIWGEAVGWPERWPERNRRGRGREGGFGERRWVGLSDGLSEIEGGAMA
ncbi:uncharacterized protein A4U43_C09F10220 [Asparagus officinalis]|uniref:Uncharacterized protein n=1 Tax=Asparagus officinalis TaxID=4686 RepID=A0A5P1E6I5_ASPOF|nr:uncharacterized protein A4U43_C09F10220 [Asparagus officinalis]